MSKKILVLTGSARKGGNSNRMAQAFAEASAARGNEVKVIDTTKLKLNFCHACQTCYKTGKPCTFDDDFNTITGMMVPEQWPAFKPSLIPSGIIYNIHYGQPNIKTNQKVLLIRGIANGLESEMLFQNKNGVWKLIKFMS